MGRNVTFLIYDDKTKAPINGATVQLSDCNGIDRGTGTTRTYQGVDGWIGFGNVPDGVGFVTIQKEGYTTTERGQIWIDKYHFLFKVYIESSAPTAQTATVNFLVVTPYGNQKIPVMNAHIQMVKVEGAGVFEGDAGANGVLVFQNVPYGRWSVFVSRPGYISREYSHNINIPNVEGVLELFLETPEPPPEEHEYRLEITFRQWAHGGLGRILGALSQIQTALSALNWDAGHLTWGNVAVIEGTENHVKLGVPIMLSGAGSIGKVKTLVAWLKPLMKPAMYFILGLGGLITAWKVVDVVDHHEENAQQDQKTELGQYLLDEGYSPEAIKKILAAIYGGDSDLASMIIPVALLGAGAYVLSEVLRK